MTQTLDAPAGTTAYTPAQIRSAYGVNSLSEDGTGQTIAIVDAYDDPEINASLDKFDSQFGLAATGPTLYQQYGPASSFLTVLNQLGQPTSLPTTDPSGPGADNWEVEEALDVEWAHAVAPGAKIVLVEANSQSLSDLMAAVGTASAQPGVSVVSMSWGFPEGQDVFAADEAAYDAEFQVPGVTFVASTGDFGTADPEYPAFSPYVVSVGGTSLSLDADNTYQNETGWGGYSSAAGVFIGSGGGLSLYESEPAYQAGVQSTGSRTTPDVSLVADPATGAWIADPYNLDPSDPFEIVGGTSLSAPAWAGLLALVDQGRVAAGQPTLDSASPTETQQALYHLPQNNYNVVASGTNGYTADAGYNLVTGLGTPVANLLVSDLVAYHGPGTTYSGATVAPLQDATLTDTGGTGGGPINAINVFDAFTVTSAGFDDASAPVLGLDASARLRPSGQILGATALYGSIPGLPVTTSGGGAVVIGSGSLSSAAPSPGGTAVSSPRSLTSATLVAPSFKLAAGFAGAQSERALRAQPSASLRTDSIRVSSLLNLDQGQRQVRVSVPDVLRGQTPSIEADPSTALMLWDDAIIAYLSEGEDVVVSPVAPGWSPVESIGDFTPETDGRSPGAWPLLGLATAGFGIAVRHVKRRRRDRVVSRCNDRLGPA